MSSRHYVFRMNDGNIGPDLLRQVLLENNWRPYDENSQGECDWNLWWKSSRFSKRDYDQLEDYQRLNHFPKVSPITKKDGLVRNMRRMQVICKGAFDFTPVAYNLPNEYKLFVKDFGKRADADESNVWICKPADLSRGRGIFLFKDLSELQYHCTAVVQRYISNPLLVAGYKFDIRLYVFVPSFQPLRVYIHNDGLVRFATDKFDLDVLNDVYAHLTNTSINKNAPNLGQEREHIGNSYKWNLNQLRNFFHQSGIDDRRLWIRIQSLVCLTLLSQLSQLSHLDRRPNCFELYGFDVLVDENLKPWLLEVNFSPSLNADTNLDIQIKRPMLRDLIKALEMREQDKDRGRMYERGTLNSRLSRRLHRQTTQKPRQKYDSVFPRFGNDSPMPAMVRLRTGCGLPAVQNPYVYTQTRSSSGVSSSDSDINNDSIAHAETESHDISDKCDKDQESQGGKQNESDSNFNNSAIGEEAGIYDHIMKEMYKEVGKLRSTNNVTTVKKFSLKQPSISLRSRQSQKGLRTNGDDSGFADTLEVSERSQSIGSSIAEEAKPGESRRWCSLGVESSQAASDQSDVISLPDEAETNALARELHTSPGPRLPRRFTRQRKPHRDSKFSSLPSVNQSHEIYDRPIRTSHVTYVRQKPTHRRMHTSHRSSKPIHSSAARTSMGRRSFRQPINKVLLPKLRSRRNGTAPGDINHEVETSRSVAIPSSSSQQQPNSMHVESKKPGASYDHKSTKHQERYTSRLLEVGSDNRLYPTPQYEPRLAYGGFKLAWPCTPNSLELSNAKTHDVRACAGELMRLQTLASRRVEQVDRNTHLLQGHILHTGLWPPYEPSV